MRVAEERHDIDQQSDLTLSYIQVGGHKVLKEWNISSLNLFNMQLVYS